MAVGHEGAAEEQAGESQDDVDGKQWDALPSSVEVKNIFLCLLC